MNTKPNLINDSQSSTGACSESEGNMAQIEKYPSKTLTAKSVLRSITRRAVGSYKAAGVATSMMFASSSAFGLGLGVLDVQSNLDQPLNGLITVSVAPGDDVTTLDARVASREEFEALGIDYPDYLKDIKLRVERSGAGAVLRVSSDNVVIKEPFIHFLVKVTWSGGNFVREYTALIDPPVYAAEAPKSISRPKTVGTDQSFDDSDSYEDTGSAFEDDAVVESVDVPSSGDFGSQVEDTVDSGNDLNGNDTDARYGPVAAGESLSLIAQELQRQVPDLSIYAIMQALFEENPDAFIDQNINGLIRGSVLNIRDLDQIRAADLQAARDFFQQQVSDWDPSSLVASSSGESGIGVGQDNYTSDTDLFGGTGDTDSTVTDSFQVGASSDTNSFVSAAQGDNSDGEVLALTQEISQLQSSLASSELENQELTARISILEGQLADMNRLMSLGVEDAELANLESTLAQQNAEQAEGESGSLINDDLSEFLTDSEVSADAEELSDAGTTDDLLNEFLTDNGDGENVDVADEFGLDQIGDALEEGADELSGDLAAIGDSATDAIDSTSSVIEEIVEDTTTVSNTPTINSTPEEKSLLDKIGGIVPVLGGLGTLLLAGLGLFIWRRRRADEEFEISMLSIESNSQSIDIDTESGMSASMSASVTASTMSGSESDASAEADKETSFLTVYSDSDAVVQADEVDPIAEADVYIAYGRDEQAEEVLLDGISAHPDRVDVKQKLIGLYFKNKNTEGFERIAEELFAQRDSMTGEAWQEISDMGKELVPENPLFALSGIDFDVVEQASENEIDEAAESPSEDEGSLAFGDDEKAAAEEKSEMIVDSIDDESVQLINFDDGRSEISELDEVEIDALAGDDGDDDVLSFSSDIAADGKTPEVDLSGESDKDIDELSENDLVLDFDAESSDDEKEFGSERRVSEVPEVSDLVIDPEYDEAETQYELAKVFVDLGDEDGARKILNELVATPENSDELIAKSQELLDSMNS